MSNKPPPIFFSIIRGSDLFPPSPPKTPPKTPPKKRKLRSRSVGRRKRRRTDGIYSALDVPKKINTIKDLIVFSHTYTGNNVDVEKLLKIEPSLKKLDKMVGLDTVKRSILDMIMHFAQGYHDSNEDYLHMVVCGPPGCGKTMLCRIIGEILSGLGVLPKDTFNIVKRTDFVAKYLGQSAHKAQKTLEKCVGGVMFIDEAYSLAPRDTSRDSFAKEAIDILNQFLSEHKNDLCCIVAGYEEELDKTFFAMNEGLKRRFPWRFSIEPYTDLELLKIFEQMVDGVGYKLAQGAVDASFFKKNKNLFKFAGGDIETFVTKCKFAHVRNTFGKTRNHIISKEDITFALKQHEKSTSNKKTSGPPGTMYT